MKKNILLIGGSLNQTTMMHQIGQQLVEHHCFYTPYFGDGVVDYLAKRGWLDFSVLGGPHRRNTLRYLTQHNLPLDPDGRARSYDLVVTCSDLLVQKALRGKRVVLVQEGMTEPEGLAYHLVKALRLPRYLANTSTTGLSDAYDAFCVASPGYRDLFIHKGVRPEKIMVTGIPNFDNAARFLNNNFPHRGYVLAATSSSRETFKFDNRAGFIRKVRRIADGRPIVFKFHPNENLMRAMREVQRYAPEALTYTDGDIGPMIANCDVFITQNSSATYLGLALGKEVHTDLNLESLRRLAPLQNGGTSALAIAEVCQRALERPLGALTPALKPTAGFARPKPADAL